MSVQNDNETTLSAATHDGRPAPLSRRALMKRGAATLPVILTLQSGAALARSSNLISASHRGTTDRRGRTLCVDKRSVYRAGHSRRVYDLGEPPYARGYAIRDLEFHERPDEHSPVFRAPAVCRGQTAYYRDSTHDGWQEVHVHGFIVSATALRSFAGHIHFTEI